MATNLSKALADEYKDNINLFLKDFSSTIPVISLFNEENENDTIKRLAEWAKSGRLKILTSFQKARSEGDLENGVISFKIIDSDSNKVITELHTSKNQDNTPLYEIVNWGLIKYSIGEWENGLRIDFYINGDKLNFSFIGENVKPHSPALQYVKRLLNNFPIYYFSFENFEAKMFEKINSLYNENKALVNILKEGNNIYLRLYDTKGSSNSSDFEEFYRVPLEDKDMSDIIMWLYNNNSLQFSMGKIEDKVFFAFFINFEKFEIRKTGVEDVDYFI